MGNVQRGSDVGYGWDGADHGVGAVASRERAEHGPARVAEQSEIDIAVGVLMGRSRIGPEQARADLQEAARGAGTDPLSIARAIIEGLRERRPG
jgi:hypothetical protein